MATHALIALRSHSSFHAAYLHFDGSPEKLGPILKTHFNTVGKIWELIQLGAIKSIAQDGEKTLLDDNVGLMEADTEKKLFPRPKNFGHSMFLFMNRHSRIGKSISLQPWKNMNVPEQNTHTKDWFKNEIFSP